MTTGPSAPPPAEAASAARVDVHTLAPEITRALRAAFGDAPIEDVTVLPGGRSGATMLALRVAGAGYVVRRSDPRRPAHEIRGPREVACMTLASGLGIAPKVLHADVATCVTIMERIVPTPPSSPRDPRRTERIARAVRRLHDGPAFPASNGPMAMVASVDEVLRARGAGGLPEGVSRTLAELALVTRRFAESAPCHNDLNPGNILETDDAVYFVDWETASQNDPFFDLGGLGVFAFPTADLRAALLEAYLGRLPSDEEQARALVGRVMALGVYAAAFTYALAAEGGIAPSNAAPLPLLEALQLLRASPGRAPAEILAASLAEEMRTAAAAEGFAEAKRVVAGP